MTRALAASSLYVVLLVVTGYGILTALLRQRTLNIFAVLGFSFVLGAFASALVGVLLLITGHFDLAVLATWLLALASGLSVLWRVVRHRPLPGLGSIRTLPRKDIVLLVVLAIAFTAMTLAAALGPLIAWDAVVIWLGKAKSFFFEAGLPNGFYLEPSFGIAHLDYPIGFPALIATAYRFAGVVLEPAAAPLLASFWFATVLLLVGVVRHISQQPRLGLSLLLLLVVLPVGQFLEFYANGYADMPVAACIATAVAAAIFAAEAGDLRRGWPYLAVAWLAAVLAAMLKNEGLSFLIATALSIGLYVLLRAGPRRLLARGKQQPAAAALVVLAVLASVSAVAAWMVTATQLNYPNDLAAGPPPHDSLTFYTDRLLTVLRFAMSGASNVIDWLWFLIPTLLAFAATWWHVLRHPKTFSGYWLAGWLIVLQAGAYLLVYLRTPHDIIWHLGTTFDRLALHLAPALAIAAVGYWLVIERTKRKGSGC